MFAGRARLHAKSYGSALSLANGERLPLILGTLKQLLTSDKPVMLLFTNPDCGPCDDLLPEISRWQEEHAEKFVVSLVSQGDAEKNRAKTAEHGLRHVLLQKAWEVSEAYQVEGTPSAVLVGYDGRLAVPSPAARRLSAPWSRIS
jgi:thiol-disulfide isomerase/thioredoxin